MDLDEERRMAQENWARYVIITNNQGTTMSEEGSEILRDLRIVNKEQKQ